ncbi:hypothetical protein WR25_12181 [Diploscapter pachys]|uniref:Uncharacterized protein n=1 Tax=Diploscapter pachys TaxID=2018661 RepID=A0A2A2LHC8_9BILA|nr:hypothetical protein WR25_12181 [Diploscapter pachys]
MVEASEASGIGTGKEKKKDVLAATFFCAEYEKNRTCSIVGSIENAAKPLQESIMSMLAHNSIHYRQQFKQNAHRFKCNSCQETCYFMFEAVKHQCKTGKPDMRPIEINVENANVELDFFHFMNAHFIIANNYRSRFPAPANDSVVPSVQPRERFVPLCPPKSMTVAARPMLPSVIPAPLNPAFDFLQALSANRPPANFPLVGLGDVNSDLRLNNNDAAAAALHRNVKRDRALPHGSDHDSTGEVATSPNSRISRRRSHSHENEQRRRPDKVKSDPFERVQEQRAIGNLNPRYVTSSSTRDRQTNSAQLRFFSSRKRPTNNSSEEPNSSKKVKNYLDDPGNERSERRNRSYYNDESPRSDSRRFAGEAPRDRADLDWRSGPGNQYNRGGYSRYANGGKGRGNAHSTATDKWKTWKNMNWSRYGGGGDRHDNRFLNRVDAKDIYNGEEAESFLSRTDKTRKDSNSKSKDGRKDEEEKKSDPRRAHSYSKSPSLSSSR